MKRFLKNSLLVFGIAWTLVTILIEVWRFFSEYRGVQYYSERVWLIPVIVVVAIPLGALLYAFLLWRQRANRLNQSRTAPTAEPPE